ncbi:Stp1/IreP family PP2C-type Ser/Thr phosphatase [Furfurilactobacillus siliginis]|uniref:Protein phosphatase n=1 Tax=Furfurilactobacillus siliginis TaxID=348151 RepID=A0A0R2LE97_9LACO|nr:Stp1/IreP family PP2C-type Ser/Thr phosphatase [Furfurilactobacillus siliginis]KRN96893.1 serine threonine specific protein phosphatase [Furfurilactobacillus siliginis]GEK28089.1 protein phosphatase [Furfurilactobacillus siliginis]
MQVAYLSDVGKQREDNQDYVGTFTNQAGLNFAIVADGIGGHQGGDVAATMAVSHIGTRFEDTAFTDPATAAKWLSSEAQQENDTIIEKAHQYRDLGGMGTTIVAAITFDEQFLLANIGDSRGYVLRADQLSQLTEDHSLVNELVKMGEISAADARKHPKKNIITRTLGINDEADIDINLYHAVPGDLVMLCSDGLTNMVTDAQIQMVLKGTADLQTKCQQLIDLANDGGGLDNITVLLMAADRGVTAP